MSKMSERTNVLLKSKKKSNSIDNQQNVKMIIFIPVHKETRMKRKIKEGEG